MACHQFERVQVSAQKLCGTPRAILMIDPVKSVAANTVFEPLIRPRIHRRSRRQSAMKSGIENRDLRNSAQELFNNLHAFEFGAIMERSESRNVGDSRSYFGSKRNRFFVFRAAMHHAVPDNVNVSKRRHRRPITVRQSAK